MSSPAPRPIVLSTQDKFTKEIRDGGVPIAELKWLWNPLFVDLQEVSAEVLTDANAIVRDTFHNATASTTAEILERATACLGVWPKPWETSAEKPARIKLGTICEHLNMELKRKVKGNESAMQTQNVQSRTEDVEIKPTTNGVEIKPAIEFKVQKSPTSDVIVISLTILFDAYRDYESRQENEEKERTYEYKRIVEHKLMLGSYSEVGKGSTNRDGSTRTTSVGTSRATDSATITGREPSVDTASSGFSWRKLGHSLSSNTVGRLTSSSKISRNL